MVEIFMPNSLCPNPPISKTSFPPSSMGVKNKWLHTTPQTSSKGLLLMHWASLLTRGVGFSLEKRYDHCQDTIPPYKEGTPPLHGSFADNPGTTNLRMFQTGQRHTPIRPKCAISSHFYLTLSLSSFRSSFKCYLIKDAFLGHSI